MRLWVAIGGLVVLAGCAVPPSTGALWAQQVLDQENGIFRVSDAQRTAQARDFELGVADADVATERARIGSGLQDCPGGARQALVVSSGDRLRDGIRIRIGDDAARLSGLAQVALADWQLRRARATGDASRCDQARQTLAGSSDTGQTTGLAASALAQAQPPDLLAGLGSATVSRNPAYAGAASGGWSPNQALSNYALGYVDTLQAASPLPHYLAAVYGGQLVQRSPVPDLGGATPEEVVDSLAPGHPEWEPDALYEALRPA